MTASAFSAAWLQQREPFDTAARESAALQLGEAAVAQSLARPGGVLHVVDLGAGTGANLRYLAPRLGGRQHWRVLDHDAALLAAWPALLSDWARALGGRATWVDGAPAGDARAGEIRAGDTPTADTPAGDTPADDIQEGRTQVGAHPAGDTLRVRASGLALTVQRHCCDLSRPLPGAMFDGADLITASALLDLMSAPCLDALLARGSDAGAAWWFALSVDGRIGWPAPDPDDAFVTDAYSRHQVGDKGFGPALGPRAPAFSARWLAQRGYRLRQAGSDWQLDGAMQAAQINDMAEAATAAQPEAARRIGAWRERRLASAAGAGLLRVGHQELIALPVSPKSPVADAAME